MDPASSPSSYVLPLAAGEPVCDAEFTTYLSALAQRCELMVVDGSPPQVWSAHHRAWSPFCRHVQPRCRTVVGKVGNVITGIRLASHEKVIVADDDVRYGPELEELLARLDEADVVRPQNYFDPLPWHAVWDSGRSLLNRAWGGDWPGTLALRRSTFMRAGGYAGDVMFENYEMCRTIEAVGGRHVRADDIFVRRLPPSDAHFWSQRVRQAYDEWARPWRLAGFLTFVPAVGSLAVSRWKGLVGPVLAGGAILVVGAAETGRRKGRARAYFPFRCSVAAPLWVLERAVTAWAAVAARAAGGVRYRGTRIRRAALSPAERRRWLSNHRSPCPDAGAAP